jgi:hypothetical protein
MNPSKLLTILSLILVLTSISTEAKIQTDNSENYCIALRGNGELIPAHWGSMANVIEKYGEPSKAAGGSSATISLFLLESLKMNPYITSNPKLRSQNMALLLKSFTEYFDFLSYSSPEGKIINYWLTDPVFQAKISQFAKIIKEENPDKTGEPLEDFAKRNLAQFLSFFNESDSNHQMPSASGLLPFINPHYLEMISETIKLSQSTDKEKALTQIKFRYQQAIQSIQLLGAFNAQTDNQLFFRPGVVNFTKLAWRFAHMADAYSAMNASKKTVISLNQFLNSCGPISIGKNWSEINKANPDCSLKFHAWMKSSYKDSNGESNTWAKNPRRLNDKIGKYMDIFPVTSAVTGQSIITYNQYKSAYNTTTDPKFGSNFHIREEDLNFGYWGNSESLDKIETELKQLYPTDYKSHFFKKLGSVTWEEILKSSPAEPGLSVAVELKQTAKNIGEPVLSFGGWPDLHPVLVLKASGCKNVVFITRSGGDSLFGQGVFKRLTQLDGFEWNKMTPEVNDKGISSDLTSSWGRFYNLGNSQSSFSLSLKESSAIYCTNWNALKIQDGPSRLSDHGYSEAKLFLKSGDIFLPETDLFPGCH